MKKYTAMTLSSIHQVYTSKGWEYLLLPISVMEYTYHFERETNSNTIEQMRGKDTLFLN